MKIERNQEKSNGESKAIQKCQCGKKAAIAQPVQRQGERNHWYRVPDPGLPLICWDCYDKQFASDWRQRLLAEKMSGGYRGLSNE